MPNILITGVTGFVGSHYVDYLSANFPDVSIHGLARWRSPLDNIQHCLDKVELHYGDLEDLSSLQAVINEVKPDFVSHLAAQSYVPYSFDAPIATLNANCIGTCNLLEAIKIAKDNGVCDPVVHVCASSEVYGDTTPDEVPITEDNPLRGASAYGVSKICEDMLGMQYWLSYQVKTIRTRMFTHSISYESPILVRDKDGHIDIIPISDVRKARETTSQECWDHIDLQVWDGERFADILNISAHKLNDHKLLKFVTGHAITDVTDNHSVYDGDDNLVDAGDLDEGGTLAVRKLPIENSGCDSVSSGFAWLLGFLVAEGCIKDNRRISFSNADQALLNKTHSLIKSSWGKRVSLNKDGSVYNLSVLDSADLAKLFNDHASSFGIYTRCVSRCNQKRFKKIPKIILNSSNSIQRSFLEGYNAGDGRRAKHLQSAFQEFKTNSQCLASGLCFLINKVTGQDFTLNCEDRVLDNNKIAYYYSINLRSNSGHGRMLTGQHFKKESNIIKKRFIVSEDPNEFVYDLETQTHYFSSGIGSVKVHNTGPRRGEVFVLSNFSKQIVQIEMGLQEPVVKVGNLDSVRTFADVRDTVRAYWILLHECEPGEVYNIGGNTTVTMRQMLQQLIAMSTLKENIKVEVDPKRLRPSDVTLQVPCIDKFVKKTGWKPEIPFEQTLEDTLNYWREKLK